MKKISILKAALFLLGITILFLLVKKSGPEKVLNAVKTAKISLIAAGALIYIALIIARSSKWFLLSKHFKPELKYSKFLPFYLINCLLSAISPLKTGEAATPLILKKYLGIPFGQGLSVVIFDRAIELAIFSLLFLSAVFYLVFSGISNYAFLTAALFAFLAILFLTLAIIVFFKKPSYALKIIGYLKKFSFAEKLSSFLKKELSAFYEGIKNFKKISGRIAAITAACWLLEILAFYLVFSSAALMPFLKVASGQIMGIAASFITFIPAGIGIGEIGVIYVLASFGFSSASASAGALIARIVLTGTLIVSGAIGSLFIGRKK